MPGGEFPSLPEEDTGLSSVLWEKINPFYSEDMMIDGGPDGARLTRSYLVPWQYMQEAYESFLGWSYMFTDTGTSQPYMVRHLPECVEYLYQFTETGTIAPYLWAQKVRVKQYGGGGYLTDNEFLKALNQPYRMWDYAMFTVEYTTRAEDIFTRDQIQGTTTPPAAPQGVWPLGPVEANRYVVWNDDEAVKFPVIEGGPGGGQWVTKVAVSPTEQLVAPKPAGNKIGIPDVSGSVSMTWFEVAEGGYNVGKLDGFGNYISGFRYLQGKGNDKQFFDYAPQTLVFTGWKRRRRRSALGRRIFNFEFTFLERPNGVNSVIGPFGYYGAVQTQTNNPSTGVPDKPIKLADFDQLFEPPPI